MLRIQKMSDMAPRTSSLEGSLAKMLGKTYRGDVPACACAPCLELIVRASLAAGQWKEQGELTRENFFKVNRHRIVMKLAASKRKLCVLTKSTVHLQQVRTALQIVFTCRKTGHSHT